MCNCGTLQEEDDELNYQVEVEMGEYWNNKVDDSEYQQGIDKITREEVARVIEFNRQTQEIETSSLSE